MSEHRFHLEKYYLGGKIACPACKRTRCFVRYIDERDIIKFPSDVGRCDHENSCGYHYTPKDFFHDNPDMKPKDWDENYTPAYQPKSIVGKEVTKPTAPSFIPSELVCGRFKYQVRIYSIFLLKTNIGDLNFNFSLGLLLILFCIYAKYCIDMVFILNPFGTYCLISIFAFSTAPFCHGA